MKVIYTRTRTHRHLNSTINATLIRVPGRIALSQWYALAIRWIAKLNWIALHCFTIEPPLFCYYYYLLSVGICFVSVSASAKCIHIFFGIWNECESIRKHRVVQGDLSFNKRMKFVIGSRSRCPIQIIIAISWYFSTFCTPTAFITMNTQFIVFIYDRSIATQTHNKRFATNLWNANGKCFLCGISFDFSLLFVRILRRSANDARILWIFDFMCDWRFDYYCMQSRPSSRN